MNNSKALKRVLKELEAYSTQDILKALETAGNNLKTGVKGEQS